jgi:hypothetical protein
MRTITLPNFRYALLPLIAGGFIVTWSLSDGLPIWPAAATAPSQTVTVGALRLPFTFQDVVRHFEDAVGPAQERSNVQAAFRGGTLGENFYEIVASRHGSDLLLRIQVNDNYGMNLVREFFEASFFDWRESEQFYALLDGRSGSRAVTMPRFHVLWESGTRGEVTTISMTFSPRFRTLSAQPQGTPH